MKIAYLSTALIPSRTANSVHIMKMCAALVRAGHSVTLFTPPAPKVSVYKMKVVFSYYGVPENFRLIRIYKPQFNFGVYVYALLVAIRLVLGRFNLVFSRNLLCSIFAAKTGQPQILEIHQPITQSSFFQRKAFNKLIQRYNFQNLIVITQPLKRIYLTDFGVPEEKIIVAADGADLPNKKIDYITDSTGHLQVGYLGHLYAGRGIELIIAMAQECPWAEFHIVGGNPDDIKRVRNEAENLNNVRVHGFLSPAKAEQFRFQMDVLLAPYQTKVGLQSGKMTTEKWMSPLKVFEYMASGKASICSDIPVLHEVLIPEENCLMCPPDDIECWVDSLKRLNKDPVLRKQLGRVARNDIESKYSWHRRATRILAEGLSD